ncbi:MAG: hypothetical protein HONDAALG_02319 [Gammaproteobacteria bacterium]|nr:hypothetical protein [Gammaproteobacteria bacterium]
MSDQPRLPQDPDILMAATLFLMTQYAIQRRAAIAEAIVEHLEQLRRRDVDLPPRLRAAVPRLHQQWLERFGSGRIDPPASPAPRGIVVPFSAKARRS